MCSFRVPQFVSKVLQIQEAVGLASVIRYRVQRQALKAYAQRANRRNILS
jgi:hypothetical protein